MSNPAGRRAGLAGKDSVAHSYVLECRYLAGVVHALSMAGCTLTISHSTFIIRA
jgi:hypothetical protein